MLRSDLVVGSGDVSGSDRHADRVVVVHLRVIAYTVGLTEHGSPELRTTGETIREACERLGLLGRAVVELPGFPYEVRDPASGEAWHIHPFDQPDLLVHTVYRYEHIRAAASAAVIREDEPGKWRWERSRKISAVPTMTTPSV